jgi:hypothetical protein
MVGGVGVWGVVGGVCRVGGRGALVLRAWGLWVLPPSAGLVSRKGLVLLLGCGLGVLVVLSRLG